MITWLRRIFAGGARGASAALPAGLTDVVDSPLRGGLAPADLVDYVIAAALGATREAEIERGLVERFGISPDDAALVRDRTFGGIFRAATRIHENRAAVHPVRAPPTSRTRFGRLSLSASALRFGDHAVVSGGFCLRTKVEH